MQDELDASPQAERTPQENSRRKSAARKRRRRQITLWLAALCLIGTATGVWLSAKAESLKSDLQATADLVPALKDSIAKNDPAGAASIAEAMRKHTATARDTVSDPIWTLASSIPWIGNNFSAASEVARSADDVTTLAVSPLVKVFESLDWNRLMPTSEGADLKPLREAAPSVQAASSTVRNSAERLGNINSDQLLPQLAEALREARAQLSSASDALEVASAASRVAPSMLGVDEPRKYLLLVQNNAEIRATGGIPASVAVVTLQNGKLLLSGQTTAEALGIMSPVIETDLEQKQLYSARLGKFMQDVNLTPDFPTTAALAKSMWQQKTGEDVDGVLSVDPVALGFLLEATGPLALTDPHLVQISGDAMPKALTGDNVVRTLLSDVYEKIPAPAAQDLYFAGVAQQIFYALSATSSEPKKVLAGLTRGVDEGRIRVWSADSEEQRVINDYPLSGAVSGPSVSPAQFGVYFNDGTGAKMDYYVKRTVQLVKECAQDGYEQTSVRITTTNSAPADAATSLPAYVTGNGHFGVPPGSVQTNIVAYGPVQANVETTKLNGEKADFAPYSHDGRPVGVVAVRLAPGESKTVDFTFGKIVQHTEPNLVVTPTVQDVKDVILPTQNAQCG